MHAELRDRGWIMKHMKIKRLMHDPAMHLPRQRCLFVTNDSDHDESLFSVELIGSFRLRL